MKSTLTLAFLLFVGQSFTQTVFPSFLEGTWKVEKEELYERWDKLNDHSLKGTSYTMEKGQMNVAEYIDITRVGKTISYTATVIGQNDGKPVSFKLTKSDSIFTFENPEHDFPKKVIYRKINDVTVQVEVTDGAKNSFGYTMTKQVAEVPAENTTANPKYDAALAEKLGSDDYGMKGYIFVILKSGTNKTTDQAVINEKFGGHMDNINRLVEEKKLVVAGPMGKNDKDYRGIFILSNVTTIEEAKTLLQTDPAIAAGLLDFEVYNWYGSAALSEYLEASDKIWKKQY